MMKFLIPSALLSLLLLTACGSSRRQVSVPQTAMRYDTVTRAWVPLNTPTVRPATRPPHDLAPEKASDTAQIIETTAPAVPVQPGTDIPLEDKPGLLKRVGRAATSPLRAVGIGN
jgi:hypothetical protein